MPTVIIAPRRNFAVKLKPNSLVFQFVPEYKLLNFRSDQQGMFVILY